MSRRMSIRDLQIEVQANAITKGWYDVPTSVGEQLALLHCEVSEATEEARRHETKLEYTEMVVGETILKPCGFGIELADVVLKALEIAAREGIDLEEQIARKHAYNKTRPYRHGKRF
jgi:NTP pyrophosphatase (non-canonical NTP hydrolase)